MCSTQIFKQTRKTNRSLKQIHQLASWVLASMWPFKNPSPNWIFPKDRLRNWSRCKMQAEEAIQRLDKQTRCKKRWDDWDAVAFLEKSGFFGIG